MKKNMVKKWLAAGLSFALAAGTVTAAGRTPVTVKAADYGLSNPRVEMQTRECIEFGSYWQEDTNGDGVADQKDEKTPVKWQILKQEGDDLFLLADKALDAKAYNTKGVEKTDSDGDTYTDYSCTWETSTLRTWMNGEFYDTLFTAEEKKAVKETEVKNEDNPYYETAGGNDTKDHLFLLSLSDILNTGYGFSDDYDQARMAKTTDYVKKKVFYINNDGMVMWWLRTPGSFYTKNRISYIDYSGKAYSAGYPVNGSLSVRPALHVKVSDGIISAALKNEVTEKIALKHTTWDTIKFGKYNGDDILWRVLSVDGDDAFLLSDKILINKAYNDVSVKKVSSDGDEYEDYSCSWNTSSLRKWLNNDFYNDAFSKEEQTAIIERTLRNIDVNSNTLAEEINTKDKICLLSWEDMVNSEYGFPTIYSCTSASRQAIKTREKDTKKWWIRVPYISCEAHYVDEDGDVCGSADDYVDTDFGVRPVLCINLSSSVWTKGEEVTSNDKKIAITDSLPSGDDGQETTKPGGEPTGAPSGDDEKETTKPDGEPIGTPSGTAAPAPTKTPEGTSGSAPTPTPVPTATPTPAAVGNTTGTTASGQASNNSGSAADSVAESTDTDSVKAPAKIKSLKVTNKKAGKTVVSFKAVSGAEGYQLQYAKNKKFTKAKKSKTTKKTTYTIKKLTKKTTYYFRVRAYVKDSSGNKKYGKWSAVKKLKIKK